jgi:hypothetical protein
VIETVHMVIAQAVDQPGRQHPLAHSGTTWLPGRADPGVAAQDEGIPL